jgi:hypothetical protein
MIEKTIDRLSQRYSIVGGLGADAEGRERLVKTMEFAGQQRDISTSSCIQTKEIDVGDEARFSLIDDFQGMPTHGNAAVKPGAYPTFYHDLVRLNMLDSPEYPFMGEMDQQRFANLIANLDSEYQTQTARYMGRWIDFLFLQSLLCGADRGLLLTTEGGLGMTLMNAPSAGYKISCKNTYVSGSGLVTWNATRATFETTGVGHAIYGLTDTATDHFSLTQHEIIRNEITSNLRFASAKAFGMELRAVALADPWLVQRILSRNTNNAWYVLMKDADVLGPKNHAIDQDQAVIIDKILYIPCDWLRAFRATGADNVQPTYGCDLTSDPMTYIKTADSSSKKCCIIYMGAKAALCARSSKVYGAGTPAENRKGGRMWFTHRYGEHKGGGICAHTKIGFKRYEPETKVGGTTEYLNNQSLVAWFYDPGPGVSLGT